MRLTVQNKNVYIEGCSDLPPDLYGELGCILRSFQLDIDDMKGEDDTLIVPQLIHNGQRSTNLAPILGRLLGDVLRKQQIQLKYPAPLRRHYPDRIILTEVYRRASLFANLIEKQLSHGILSSVLLNYESYEVVLDEVSRTLDLLRSLAENSEYFSRKIGLLVTFLPRNQPLYALASFALVPSLMAEEVRVKPPTNMQRLFNELAECLSIHEHFPNVSFSQQKRGDFVRSCAARHPESGKPLADVVIFTGTMANADRLRKQFDTRTLFIANGAGHNPVVVASDADIQQAVFSVMRLQLYNSGQDCANPNSVLVHRDCFTEFLKILRSSIKKVRVGPYQEVKNRVGPLGDQDSLVEILKVLVKNSVFLDPSTPGIVHASSGILEPTIVVRPLSSGGNYTEYFAPIFFIQCYESDSDLTHYFDDPRYAPNAMYVSLYGQSQFVDGLLQREFSDGRPMHDNSTILRNTDLHAPGVERGTKPYGGYGRGASCVSINGEVNAKPTLPLRDIFDYLVLPALDVE